MQLKNFCALILGFTSLARILAAASPPPSPQFVLKEGEPIQFRLMQPLSSKTARLGDPIELELAKDLRIDDVLIAREGSRAQGEVSLAQKAGRMGKGGDLAIRLTDMKVGDGRIRLRGTQGRTGDSKVGSTVALTLVLGPLGMMKHGKNALLPAGSTIMAYASEDVSLMALPTARKAMPDIPPPPPVSDIAEASVPQPKSSQPLLDAAGILKMKDGGLSDELILGVVAKRGVATLTPEDLIKMKAAGISDATLAKLVELGVNQ